MQDFASSNRRRLIDDYNREDNRAIATILVAVFLAGVGVIMALVVIDVVGSDDPVAQAKPVTATVMPRSAP